MPIENVIPWAADYIGIPFVERGRDSDGCDCWGLYRLILLKQVGLEVPSFVETYRRTTEGETIEDAIRIYGTENEEWTEIEGGSERLFDAVHMVGFFDAGDGRLRRSGMHVGMIVGPGILIHIERGIDAALGFYRTDRTLKRRILGFYRHRDLME